MTEKEKEKALENFKVGTLDIIILKLLVNKNIYAYEFEKEIENHSGGYIKVKRVSIYTKVHRLHEKGYIEKIRWRGCGKRYREYYSLTETGYEYLEELIDLYDDYQAGLRAILRR